MEEPSVVPIKGIIKPIPTIMQPQKTVNVNGEEVVYDITGRHDVCVVPRVLPVVEAMTAMALVDFIR